ncbi:MAG: hypothetical protein ACTSYX_05180, partial [Candidatus Thorarchaeota archaeon]
GARYRSEDNRGNPFDHILLLALFELHTFQYEHNGVDLLHPSGGWSLHTHQVDEEQQILTA